MSGGRKPQEPSRSGELISILLVDDISDVRENIKKLLAFEPDFKVVGTAGTGREGVALAKEHKPDVIIMDINMPDMDGLQATSLINKSVPTSAVIIMSVQNDADYFRQALRAGARDFLSKPVNMDDLYTTIRTVYRNHAEVRRQYEALEEAGTTIRSVIEAPDDAERMGHVITVFSPSGGAGTTTIATSLASGLMKEDIKVLLFDADLQFADIGTFLNLQAQSTLVEVAEDVEDLDVELFENIVVTHDSGVRVILGPPRPELAEKVTEQSDTLAKILEQVRYSYDFIVVDTSSHLDEALVNVFERSSLILLVGTPTLVSVKNLRFVVDLFDQLEYEVDKTAIVLNKILEERRGKQPTVPVERVETYLRRAVIGRIPAIDERLILSAINRGVPLIASDRNQEKPPIKQLVELSEMVTQRLLGGDEEVEDEENKPQRTSRQRGRSR